MNFILNLYIVYELNTLPRNRTNNFTLKMQTKVNLLIMVDE